MRVGEHGRVSPHLRNTECSFEFFPFLCSCHTCESTESRHSSGGGLQANQSVLRAANGESPTTASHCELETCTVDSADAIFVLFSPLLADSSHR